MFRTESPKSKLAVATTQQCMCPVCACAIRTCVGASVYVHVLLNTCTYTNTHVAMYHSKDTEGRAAFSQSDLWPPGFVLECQNSHNCGSWVSLLFSEAYRVKGWRSVDRKGVRRNLHPLSGGHEDVALCPCGLLAVALAEAQIEIHS